MGFCIFLLLLLGGNSPSFAGRDVSSLSNEEYKFARELEVSYYEWKLAANILLREQVNYAQERDQGLAMNLSEQKDKIQRWQEIEAAKALHVRGLLAHSKYFSSTWMGQVKLRLQKLFFPTALRRGIASDLAESNAFQQATLKFLRSYLPEPNMVLLRWGCLEDIFGRKAVRVFMEENMHMREWHSEENKSDGNKNWQDYLIVLIDFSNEKKRDKSVIQDLGNKGIEFKNFVPSSFGSLLEQAQELRNFLMEQENLQKKIILVSQDVGSSIVRSLLDQFSAYRSSKNIHAWINWNGFLYGDYANHIMGPNTYVESTRRLGKVDRLLASSDPAIAKLNKNVLFSKDLQTRMLLPLGPGFPILNFVNRDSIEQRDFSLLHTVQNKTQNYYYRSKDSNHILLDAITSVCN